MARTVNGETPPDNLTTTKQQRVDTPNGEDKKQPADPHTIMQKTEQDVKKFNDPNYDLMTGVKPQIGGNNLQDPNPNYPSATNKLSPSEMHQETLSFRSNVHEHKSKILLGLTPIVNIVPDKPKSNIDQSPMKKYIKPAPRKR